MNELGCLICISNFTWLKPNCLFPSQPSSSYIVRVSVNGNDSLPGLCPKTSASFLSPQFPQQLLFLKYVQNLATSWSITWVQVTIYIRFKLLSCTIATASLLFSYFTIALVSSILHQSAREILYFNFFKFFLNWSIVGLQCCISFRCTAQWFRGGIWRRKWPPNPVFFSYGQRSLAGYSPWGWTK